MLYVLAVTLLFSAAALAAEHAARLRRARSRWIWALTIVASLVIPMLIASISLQVPSLVTPTVSRRITSLRELTSVHVLPLNWVLERSANPAATARENRVLERAWVAVSATLATALLLNGLYLVWRKRNWRMGKVSGVLVYFAPDAGPAVVGLLRPRIVVPEWLANASASRQAMVMAHEQSHVAARDPFVLTVALFLLVVMPWNLPLWWHLHRLRHAIEVDCDARVLKEGLDAEEYGETLMDMSQRPTGYMGSVAAMSESRTFLEQRIRTMVRGPIKWGSVAASGFSGVALALVAIATQITPPVLNSAAEGERSAVVLPPEILDRYVGFYQRTERTMLHITRDGSRLIGTLLGTTGFELVALNATEFTVPDAPDALVTFLLDDQGRATGIYVHRAYYSITMHRVDRATAEQTAAENHAKFQTQAPTPGSEASLRKFIDAVRANNPNYNDMTPWMANIVGQTLRFYQDETAEAGAVQSVEFRHVDVMGNDVYEVRQERQTAMWSISLDSTGRIVEADRMR